MAHFDLIVIGSRAGEASLAHRLAPTSKRILLLERGDNLQRSRVNGDSRTVFVDGTYQVNETWYGRDGRSFHPGLHYYVEGTSLRSIDPVGCAASIVAQFRCSVMLALTLSACSPAPSQTILGSFFPSWILCGVIGVAVAVGVRQVLVSTAVDQYLLLPAITYFAIAIAASMIAWLFWFGR